MNTRITVPLSQEAYDAVSLLAEIGGVSRGRYLADTLEAAIPSFLAVAAAYRAAQAVEGEERAAIIAAMEQAERKLLEAVGSAVPTSLIPEAARPSPVPRRRERGAGEGRSDPPVTNRGVHTSPDEGQGH